MQTCPSCSKLYDNTTNEPKYLSCGHTFCKACLEIRRDFSRIKCEACGVSTKLHPGFGASSLITNATVFENSRDDVIIESVARCEICRDKAALLECVECDNLVCSHCGDLHVRFSSTRDHTIRIPKRSLDSCYTHGALVEYCCLVDGELLCKECITDGIHAKGHKYRPVFDEYSRARTRYLKGIELSFQKENTLLEQLLSVDSRQSQLSSQEDDLRQTLISDFQELQTMLKHRLQTMLQELSETYTTARENLKIQVDNITNLSSTANDILTVTTSTLECTPPTQILLDNATITSSLEHANQLLDSALTMCGEIPNHTPSLAPSTGFMKEIVNILSTD